MLKKIIKDKHIKQESLAKELGVTQSTISLWCSGKTYPTLDKIPKLARLLNYSIFELINVLIKEEATQNGERN